jgi:putative ABC transport system substrate-binding protein
VYVYAVGEFDRLTKLAALLVSERVDVIITAGTPGCLAAKRATSTIPIVFAVSSDPLSTGVVESLARPGGNITGLSLMATDLSAKRMEWLQILLPSTVRSPCFGILRTRGWHCAFAKPGRPPSI